MKSTKIRLFGFLEKGSASRELMDDPLASGEKVAYKPSRQKGVVKPSPLLNTC